ncbi:DUF4229 domain-containing protein [Microbacterium stercoris]|uniref:DUF4229 domain-containing protein n=1 Tax=Microbacterium stercoris TaxID=2820289 RepID=UPI0027DC152D|nr:DUF4229 domain-containing protein [Microbacterium stercoris]
MKNSPAVAFAVFTVLRLAAFLVPFALMMLLPAFHDLWWLAAVFAALIGLSVSVLFLRRPLADATLALANRRAARDAARSTKTERELEDELEDAANDEAQRG